MISAASSEKCFVLENKAYNREREINNMSNASKFEWPMSRHDFNLTGRSDGVGCMDDPGIAAATRYSSGETCKIWIEDINADGVAEFIFVESGRIIVRSQKGHIIWQSQICNPRVTGFSDLAGTGREKCIVAVCNLRTLAVFSGLTGEIHWKHVFTAKTVMLSHNRLKIGKIDLFLQGEQITIWPEGDDFGYLFAFNAGVRYGYLVWKTAGIGLGDYSRYNPNVLVGSFDGSKQNKIIVIQHSKIRIIDVASGQLLQIIDGPNMRNYGFAGIFDVDQDGYPELVLVNDAVQLHIAVVKYVDGEYKYLWDRYIGYGEHVMNTPPLPVRDLDGDGEQEIIYSVGDAVQGSWRVEIISSKNGALKRIIDNARVLDCADIDSDGLCELLMEKTDIPEIVICKIRGQNTEVLCTIPGKILSRPGPYKPLNQSHIAKDRSSCYFFTLEDSEIPCIVTTKDDLVILYSWFENKVINRTWRIDRENELDIIAAAGKADDMGLYLLAKKKYRSSDNIEPADKLVLLEVSNGEVAASLACSIDVEPHTPVVTDINGDGNPEIMLGKSVYYLDASAADTKMKLKETWALDLNSPGEDYVVNSKSNPGFLAAWDFDQNGCKKLLFSGSNSELILTDANGCVIWATELKKEFKGGRIVGITVGRFLNKNQYDIFANVATTADYINECMLIEAASGTVVWRRRDGHDSGMGPVDGYAAVRPLENDGLDDLLFLSGDVIAQIDGATGRDLQELQGLGDLLGTGWVGSGLFALADVDGDEKDEIILSGVWGLNNGILKWQHHSWQPLWFDYYGNATPIGTPPRFSHQGIARSGDALLLGGPRSDYKFGCVSAADGRLLWTYDLDDCLVSEVCTGDVDGDGRDEFVFGCNDGYVYALKTDGSLLFRISTGSPPGNPVLADVDQDGKIEILVATTMGSLMVIK